MPGPMSEPFVTASHEVLFDDEETPHCDACGAVFGAGPDQARSEADGADTSGKGTYVTGRGGAFVHEDVPLCPECGVAIAHAAMALWDAEEEDG